MWNDPRLADIADVSLEAKITGTVCYDLGCILEKNVIQHLSHLHYH